MVMSDKCRDSDDGFKYFVGCKEGETVKPLCIIVPQMTGYIKILKTEEKTCLSNQRWLCAGQLELRENMNTQSVFNLLHCSYNKKLNTTKNA